MATSTEHTGAMIALIPTQADVERLTLDAGEPADELHLTLYYLGDAVDVDEQTRRQFVNAITSMVTNRSLPVVSGRAFGVAHWNPLGDEPAWVLNVGDVPEDERDSENLAAVREMMLESIYDGSVNFAMPTQHSPWQPHICLAYSTDDLSTEMKTRLGDVTFDRVRLVFGGEVTDVQLGRTATVASTSGGIIVPWHTVNNHAECPDGKPWAVVKEADGSVEGCHETEAAANDQVAALYASETAAATTLAVNTDSEAPTGNPLIAAGRSKPSLDDCPEGQRKLPDGSCVSDEEYAAMAAWHGVLCTEGVTTGDGREFAPESLSWADKPLLRWQKESAHGGQHDVTVSVGRIDRVWRSGSLIMGEGVIDIESPDGYELRRRMKDGFAGGISIDADDISDADVEFVWNDSAVESEDDPLMMLFGTPEKMVFHAGRVRAATVVDIPAFVEARIQLGTLPEDEAMLVAAASAATLPRGVVAAHQTETSDERWDFTTMLRRLPNIMSAEVAQKAFAFLDDDGSKRVAKTACVGLHHEVDEQGHVGPANLTACATQINALRDPKSTFSLDEKKAIYAHLAAHLRDAGQEAPPLDEPESVTAAILLDDWRPDSTWFADPKLSVPTNITVTDQGRVYGHAAQWGQCHIGFSDQCITLPREDQHPYFMTGETLCSDGSRVAVGQITVGTGHAPLTYRASQAAEHYDNTGAAVADVAVGNDQFGVWVAGAVRASVAASRVHELRASGKISGDWRRIGGQLRLVGLLAVNVPGFPIPRPRARVASGAPLSLIAAGATVVGHNAAPPPVVSDDELDRIAMKRVMNVLATRVRGTIGV